MAGRDGTVVKPLVFKAGRKNEIGAMLASSLLWGALMGLSAGLGLLFREWQTSGLIGSVVVLFIFGGIVAYAPAVGIARRLGRNLAAERRFALAFLLLSSATIGVTAITYAVQYRLYYSEWHDAPFTVRWLFEVGFTTAAALYQFAVMGMALLFPVGLVALLGASLLFALRND